MVNEIQKDKLLLDRLNRMVPIADGLGVEHHLSTNSTITEKGAEFIFGLAKQYGSIEVGKINLDEISKNLVSAEEGASKDGVAKTAKGLEELLLNKLKELQSKFPNLNLNQIAHYVTAHAGTVSVEEGKINEASDKKAAEDLEAARQMIGMLFKPAMIAVGVGIVAHEYSDNDHNFASHNSGYANALVNLLTSGNKSIV